MKERIEENGDLRKQRGEERHFAVHESILEATIELLDSKIFTEVTIPLIADQAECSVPNNKLQNTSLTKTTKTF